MGNTTRIKPGPLALASSRPSRNTTPRAYSFRILRLEISQNAMMAITTSRPDPIPAPPFMHPPPRISAASGTFLHVQDQVLHARDLHLRPLPDRPDRAGVPVFAV